VPCGRCGDVTSHGVSSVRLVCVLLCVSVRQCFVVGGSSPLLDVFLNFGSRTFSLSTGLP
jgi:hypothetical protein